MPSETTPPPEVDAIADALAAFMLAEHTAGRSLTARALTARASARFVGCSALLGAARRDFALHAELGELAGTAIEARLAPRRIA